jgi:hypothetical protein
MGRRRSPLDDFFSAEAPLHVLRAVRAIASLSSGEVTSPETMGGRPWRPVRDGLYCPRIFGPVKDGVCACGFVGGPSGRPPESEDERCPKCGVTAGRRRLRNERWGHVNLPAPMFHPACVPAIAELVGLSLDDVRAIARREAHLEHGELIRSASPGELTDGHNAELTERLERAKGPVVDELRAEGFAATDLMVSVVPVSPPGDRPLVRMPGALRMPGPRTLDYVELVAGARRLHRLMELDAPGIILRNECAMLQATLDRLVTQPSGASRWADEKEGVGLDARPPDKEGFWISPPDPTRPVAAAFVDDESILVQFPFTVVHLDLEGQILDAFEAPSCELLGVDPDGRYALFHRNGFHVRDLQEHAFLDRVPDAFPAVFMHEDHEMAFLVDARNKRSSRLRDVVDYPAFWALSPDGLHLWVEDKEGSGGIYGTDTALREAPGERLRCEFSFPLLGIDGRLEDEAYEEREPEYPFVCALALDEEDRFVTADGRVIARDGKVQMMLAPPAPVVAFSQSAEQALVVRRDHAAIVDLEEREVSARVTLGQLADELKSRATVS